jgi:hypothetical protein
LAEYIPGPEAYKQGRWAGLFVVMVVQRHRCSTCDHGQFEIIRKSISYVIRSQGCGCTAATNLEWVDIDDRWKRLGCGKNVLNLDAKAGASAKVLKVFMSWGASNNVARKQIHSRRSTKGLEAWSHRACDSVVDV